MSLLCIFLLSIFTPINSATFEDVVLTLKWTTHSQDTKTVKVISDDYLKRYVGDFGEVDLVNQKIPALVTTSISNLPKVTHLEVMSCEVKTIEPGAFQNLPKLIELDLSGNLLEEIKDGVFSGLGIKTLYLENNKIARIEDHAFNNLQLQYLFIDHNRISRWRSDWFVGTPLETISMGNNLLEMLPRLAFEFLWHFNVDTIINLTLSSNKISSIDPDAFKGVKNIVTLDLRNNSLVHLEPGLFDTVESIDFVDLSHNKISQMYFETFRRTKVARIDLFDNFLTCVAPEVFNRTQFRSVVVTNNPISCLCVEDWTKWKKTNELPKISDWAKLQEGCKSAGGRPKSSILILLVIFFNFN